LLLLAGFSVVAQSECVRKVDFKDAPEMKDLAAQIRQVGNEVYPEVLALLSDGKSNLPRQFDVVIKRRLPSDYPASSVGRKIYINAHSFTSSGTDSEFLQRNPGLVRTILIHEMAHVAQQYKRSKAPLFWREGVADYVRYKLDGTNGPTCPQCSFQYPHYTSGYWCLGAFLLYLDTTYGSNVVRDLNAELRRGRFTDAWFGQAIGKSLDELWAEFRRTPAFTPVAAELNRLRDATAVPNASRDEEQSCFVKYIRNQPGGDLVLEAREFLSDLAIQGRLPGWRKGERGEISYGMLEESVPVVPFSRIFRAQKNSDPSMLYHYVVVRSSADEPWKLGKAWRTGPDARVVEEYPIPPG
jgi:hypothetical protein